MFTEMFGKGVDAEGALPAAERLRKTFERTDSPVGRPITVSIGIAAHPGAGATAEALFEAADEAMYRAKQEGRNRSVVAGRRE
ncbi:MAG TPA: GGDEF domain-containing protein [Paenibacillus sp.]|nr:GGDEF domain-containing protein [Paenibacillus sp.]